MSEATGMRSTVITQVRAGALAALGASLLVAATILEVLFGATEWLVEQQLPASVGWLEFGAATLAAAAAWSACSQHAGAALGLCVALLGVVVPVWAGFPELSAAAGAAVLAAAPFVVPGTAQVALRWSHDAVRSPALAAVYLLTGAAALVHVLGYDPSGEPGCARLCSRVAPIAEALLNTRTAVAISGALTIAASVVATSAVLARIHTAPPLVVGGVLTALAALATVTVLRWANWTDSLTGTGLIIVLPFCAIATVATAVLVTVFRAWRVRVALVRVASRLGTPDGIVGDLGRTITDVEFAVPGDGWVDARGHPVAEEPTPHHHVTVVDPSGPVARLLLTPGRDADDVARAITPVIRLALGNAQLAAATRARVADTQASRRRVVAASDAERRRIERDLHDGAQQRLVSAAFYLSVARGRLSSAPAELVDAESAVRESLGQLRRLAHGAFPHLLTTDGLWVAVDELARGSTVPTTVTAEPFDVDDETALAIYATAAAAIREAERQPSARHALMTIARLGGSSRVTVDLIDVVGPRPAPDYTDLADRVGALGGTLSSTTTMRGATLEAVLPCVS